MPPSDALIDDDRPPDRPTDQPLDGEVPRTKSFGFYRQSTFLSLLFGYMGYYLCRQNFSVASPLIQSAMGLDRLTIGAIASAGTVVYVLGKVMTGPFADAYGGRRVFLLGLFGSAVATILFGVGPGVGFFVFAWTLNRFFQSMGWNALVSVLSNWFPAKSYGTVMGAISISYQLGAVLATVFAGALITIGFGWRYLFLIPSLLLIFVGFGVWRFLVEHPADVGYNVEDQGHTAHEPTENGLSWFSRVFTLFTRPLFLVGCCLSFMLTLIRECFSFWAPTYFTDLGSRADLAAFQSILFPLFGSAGTFLAGWFSDRHLRGRRGPVIACSLVGATVALVGLAKVQAIATLVGLDVGTTAAVLMGATGFFIFGPYSMVGGGVLALDFGGRQTAATAAGLLDGVGYVGAALAGLGVASIVAKYQWSTAFLLLAGVSFLSIGLCLPLWRYTAVLPETD